MTLFPPEVNGLSEDHERQGEVDEPIVPYRGDVIREGGEVDPDISFTERGVLHPVAADRSRRIADREGGGEAMEIQPAYCLIAAEKPKVTQEEQGLAADSTDRLVPCWCPCSVTPGAATMIRVVASNTVGSLSELNDCPRGRRLHCRLDVRHVGGGVAGGARDVDDGGHGPGSGQAEDQVVQGLRTPRPGRRP